MSGHGCTHRDSAAAYVLGALPDDEGIVFAAHLGECMDCRHDVDELRFVVHALPAAAAPVDPPPDLKGRIMAVVNAEADLLRAAGPAADRVPERAPRRGRRLLSLRPAPAMALAGVLLALGVGTGVLVDSSGSQTRTFAATVDARGASGVLEVHGSGGTLVVSDMPPPPDGRVYQVWLKRDDRQAPDPTAALFTVNSEGQASVAVPGDLGDVKDVLVTDEPEGGSSVPTRTTPIVRVALS